MENTQLARLVDEVQELMNSVEDVSNRIHDPAGVFAKLESVGIQSKFLKRDAIIFSNHLALYLKIARQTLDLWVKAKQVADSKNTETLNVPDEFFTEQ